MLIIFNKTNIIFRTVRHDCVNNPPKPPPPHKPDVPPPKPPHHKPDTPPPKPPPNNPPKKPPPPNPTERMLQNMLSPKQQEMYNSFLNQLDGIDFSKENA